jgi:Domain of unknown function (DUF5011)
MKNNAFKTLFAAAIVLLTLASGCKKDDVTPPVVTLSASSATITAGTTYTGPTVTATDDVDGDISSKVVLTGTADVNTPGSYTLTYTATDKAGNTGTAAFTLNVNVSRDFILGTYTTSTTCSSYPYNTVASTTTFQAGSGSDKFFISLFYFNGGNVTCTVSGNTVTVDAGQNPNPIGDGVTGTGTFNASGKVLVMNYTFQPNGGALVSCSVTYTKS